jgi:Ca2+ transporting ATPase
VKDWLEYLIVGVTIIVVAVPEGLPLAVMISLSYSVKKMLIDKNFVKRLASCEIMGGANNICSDKTGTLTKNEMYITNLYIGKKDFKIDETNDKLEWKNLMPTEKFKDLFYESLCCNTTGTLPNDCSATEKAMMVAMERLETGIVESSRLAHGVKDAKVVHFTSDRKRMSTVIENCGETENGHDRRLHCKGASEYVFGSCEFYLDNQGNKQKIDDIIKNEVLD